MAKSPEWIKAEQQADREMAKHERWLAKGMRPFRETKGQRAADLGRHIAGSYLQSWDHALYLWDEEYSQRYWMGGICERAAALAEQGNAAITIWMDEEVAA